MLGIKTIMRFSPLNFFFFLKQSPMKEPPRRQVLWLSTINLEGMRSLIFRWLLEMAVFSVLLLVFHYVEIPIKWLSQIDGNADRDDCFSVHQQWKNVYKFQFSVGSLLRDKVHWFLANAHLSLHHSDPRQPPATWLLFVGPGVDL